MPECRQFFFRTMCINKKTYFNQKGMTNHNKEEDIRFLKEVAEWKGAQWLEKEEIAKHHI